MKRIITLIPLLFLLLTGCQQDIAPDYAEIPDAEVMTRSASSERLGPDDPVVFLPARDMKAWTDIGPLEDRFAACEVPSSRLNQMTTEALVKSTINYPLNYLFFAYGDPKYVVDMIVEFSPLHQELISRADAAEVFVDMYAAADLDMSIEKSDFDGDYSSLSYANTIFMENFLAANVMSGLSKASTKQKLAEAVTKKLQTRLQHPETFSAYSINPLIAIDAAETLNVVSSLHSNERENIDITVFTPFGSPIDASENEEMSSMEMLSVTNYYVSNYPEAVVRGSTTQKYNSHSYAWHDSSINNRCWIEYYDNDNLPQLNKYWTDDAYVVCSESEAEVVLCADFQHSAVVLPNGKYVSKWHVGPLMEHASMHCPFMSTNRQYFKVRTSPLTNAISISGNTQVTINQSNTYEIAESRPGLTFSWTVRFMDADYPTPFILDVSPYQGNRSCTLICQDYGLFKTMVSGYFKGREVARTQLNVIAMSL